MFVKTYGGAIRGINAILVSVEVTVSRGITFTIVGLPDTAIKESGERIRSAVDQTGLEFPRQNIVVNLAPADVRKEGSAFDLPIALGILAAGEKITAPDMDRYMVMGELSLDGTVLPIRGVLPLAMAARDAGLEGVIVPEANAAEAAVVKGIKVYGVRTLLDVLNFFANHDTLTPATFDIEAEFARAQADFDMDFADVKGQHEVRRAFEVAVAGGHNILLVGPPGSGKSMMARRLPSIMPPFTLEESLETTKIHSVAGRLPAGTHLLTTRPFRAPHHTSSPVALVGGGANPMPGEISLAHNGVLFLDELPEYPKQTLEVLRQPIEDHHVTVARAKYTVEYPAGFMMVAAMNPCPCGYYTHPTRECTCTPSAVARYKNRISGPLYDRMDIQVFIQPVSVQKLVDETGETGESSAVMRERIMRARAIQRARFADEPGVHSNGRMERRHIRQHCRLDKATADILVGAIERFNMSARAYDRILRVARTIADLAGSTNIQTSHIAEAISYRAMDRAGYGTKLPG